MTNMRPQTPLPRSGFDLPISPPETPLSPKRFSSEQHSDLGSSESCSETDSLDGDLLRLAESNSSASGNGSDDDLLDYAEDAAEIAGESFWDSDNVDVRVRVPYLHTSLLPAGAPLNMPHLVDHTTGFSEENSPRDIRLPDGIATLLFNFNKHIFTLFLDMSVEHFHFSRKEHNDFLYDLVIAREGSEIRIGFVREIPHVVEGASVVRLEWDAQVRAKILPSGLWLVYYATRYAVSDVVFGKYEKEDEGFFAEQLCRASQCHEIARQLATTIIVRQLWAPANGVEMGVTMS